jgi:hypothetical protein
VHDVFGETPRPGGEISTTPHALKFDKREQVSLKLLECKYNVNETGSSEMSLLGYAVQFSCSKVVKKLLDLGADPNFACCLYTYSRECTPILLMSVDRGL